MSELEKNFLDWSNSKLSLPGSSKKLDLKPLRQEASTRQYFRVFTKEISFVGVYNPPETESNDQFIFLAKFLKNNGVKVPQVLISDKKQGFMLVEDFGDKSYQFSINKKNFLHLYSAAIDEMITIHSCPNHPNLPSLNIEQMSKQMDLFSKWFLNNFLDIKVESKEAKLISGLYKVVLDDLVKQPQVLCHFDFECRNLMLLDKDNVGVLDFQDAIVGPIFLDPVALFKDLYFEMTDSEIYDLLNQYIEKASNLGLMKKLEISKNIRSFDLTGLQRQLRILGTLSRLYLRDNKDFRLPDLVKTLEFATKTSFKYDELKDFSVFLKNVVFPQLNKTLKKIL